MSDQTPPPITPPPINWRERFERFAVFAGQSARLVSHVLQNTERLTEDVIVDSERLVRDALAVGAVSGDALTELGELASQLPRVTRIVREVVMILGSYQLQRQALALVDAVPTERAKNLLHQRNADRLYRMCVDLRGGLVKLGQLLSTRVDLLPQPYLVALAKLQDQVPAVPTEAILERLEDALGVPWVQRFEHFDNTPLATASIAQVHAATLDDGRAVVVKVQLPGVQTLVEADLQTFRLLARALRDLLPNVDVVTIADEVYTSVHAELDFQQEARNAQRFAEALGHMDDVVIPEVIVSHSTTRVLTLERLEGERLVAFFERCEVEGLDDARDALFKTLITCFFDQVLRQGLIHADPHPGNLLALTGPRLGLLDFGCVTELTEEVRDAYHGLIMKVVANDVGGLADTLHALGFRGRTDDPAELHAFAEAFLARFSFEQIADLGSIDAREQLQGALSLAREHPIAHIPQHFVMIGRVLFSLTGLVMRFQPSLNLLTLFTPFMAPMKKSE